MCDAEEVNQRNHRNLTIFASEHGAQETKRQLQLAQLLLKAHRVSTAWLLLHLEIVEAEPELACRHETKEGMSVIAILRVTERRTEDSVSEVLELAEDLVLLLLLLDLDRLRYPCLREFDLLSQQGREVRQGCEMIEV